MFGLTQDPISLSAQHCIDMKPELVSQYVNLLPTVLLTDLAVFGEHKNKITFWYFSGRGSVLNLAPSLATSGPFSAKDMGGLVSGLKLRR